MNLDELRPILAAYRKQAEPAWSPATAHPGYDGKAGAPAGQCGVTSAWLQRRLREDHGIEAWYCVGSVYAPASANLDHCWLEVGEGWSRLVIDLTAEQAVGYRRVLCAEAWEMHRDRITYAADRRLSPDEVAADPVQPRLAILTEALS